MKSGHGGPRRCLRGRRGGLWEVSDGVRVGVVGEWRFGLVVE